MPVLIKTAIGYCFRRTRDHRLSAFAGNTHVPVWVALLTAADVDGRNYGYRANKEIVNLVRRNCEGNLFIAGHSSRVV
jgi:hypothetical protein